MDRFATSGWARLRRCGLGACRQSKQFVGRACQAVTERARRSCPTVRAWPKSEVSSLVHNALLEKKDAIDTGNERGGREQRETVSQLAVLADERATRASKLLAWIALGAAALDDRNDLRQQCGAAAHDITYHVC